MLDKVQARINQLRTAEARAEAADNLYRMYASFLDKLDHEAEALQLMSEEARKVLESWVCGSE